MISETHDASALPAKQRLAQALPAAPPRSRRQGRPTRRRTTLTVDFQGQLKLVGRETDERHQRFYLTWGHRSLGRRSVGHQSGGEKVFYSHRNGPVRRGPFDDVTTRLRPRKRASPRKSPVPGEVRRGRSTTSVSGRSNLQRARAAKVVVVLDEAQGTASGKHVRRYKLVESRSRLSPLTRIKIGCHGNGIRYLPPRAYDPDVVRSPAKRPRRQAGDGSPAIASQRKAMSLPVSAITVIAASSRCGTRPRRRGSRSRAGRVQARRLCSRSRRSRRRGRRASAMRRTLPLSVPAARFARAS